MDGESIRLVERSWGETKCGRFVPQFLSGTELQYISAGHRGSG